MENLEFTPEELERHNRKATRTSQVLSAVEKGEEDNVINCVHVFEAKLWHNNKAQWTKVFDTRRKV